MSDQLITAVPTVPSVSSDMGTLKRLSIELRLTIFELVVKVDRNITPFQVKAKSNKFYWTQTQILGNKDLDLEGRPVAPVPQLDVASLSLVCKAIYDEVATTHLFYKVNEFDFQRMSLDKSLLYAFKGHGVGQNSTENMITFLVAITEERRNQIEHIHLDLRFGHSDSSDQAILFNLLTGMRGLRTMDMYMYFPYTYLTGGVYKPEESKGYHSCLKFLTSTSGLKVKVHNPEITNDMIAGLLGTPAQTSTQKANTLRHIAEHKDVFFNHTNGQALIDGDNISAVGKKQVGTNFSLLAKAKKLADLDIYGEGRLNGDHKPHLISSHTRGAIQNSVNVDKNGILATVRSKYDLNGDLSWYVQSIKECRYDEGFETFEYLVESSAEWNDDVHEESWEGFSSIDASHSGHHRLKEFYKHEGSDQLLGREEAMGVWKGEQDAKLKRMAKAKAQGKLRAVHPKSTLRSYR